MQPLNGCARTTTLALRVAADVESLSGFHTLKTVQQVDRGAFKCYGLPGRNILVRNSLDKNVSIIKFAESRGKYILY